MLRAGYETDCQFNKGGPVGRIRWYRCQPGAPALGYVSAIMPLGWLNAPYLHRGVGEVFNAEKVFSPGTPIPGATGQRVCGTEEDFATGGEYRPDLPDTEYTPEGLALCCGAPPGGVLVGGDLEEVPTGGALLGGDLEEVPTGGAVIGGGYEMGTTGYCEGYRWFWNPPTSDFREMLRVTPGVDFWSSLDGNYTLEVTPGAAPQNWTFIRNDPYTVWEGLDWTGLSCLTFAYLSGEPADAALICCGPSPGPGPTTGV